MRAVLGIDAAWTAPQPSGVALCVERDGAWRCLAVAPSYADFIALGEGEATDWRRPRIAGGPPEPGKILRAARSLAPDARVEAVALDVPLSLAPITGRRRSDQEVSRRFGGRKCSTHSPSPDRPGRIASSLRSGLEASGFALATVAPTRGGRAFLEVYPHTALLSLLDAPERVPYKVAKSGRYWPGASPDERRRKLLDEWRRILAALGRRVEVTLPLPDSSPSFSAMKRYEDALDAVICAWVAIEFLEGHAEPLGDETAAIWTPR